MAPRKSSKGDEAMHKKLHHRERSTFAVGEIEPEFTNFGFEETVQSYEHFGVAVDMDKAIIDASLFDRMSEEAKDLLIFILTGPSELVWNYYIPACKTVYKEIRKRIVRKSKRNLRDYKRIQGRTKFMSREDIERRIEETSESVLIEIRNYLRECTKE
jgi:hypothetical protein